MSTPTSTLMMATPNSANKWDYKDKGTYDNLQIAVAHRLIDLRNGSETHRTNKTSNDGYCKDTALNESNYSPKKRRPLREKLNESLVNKAGFVTIEAVNILTNHLAIKEETLHFGSTLGFYPDAYTGLKNCHLRALYAVLPRAAKLALSSKVKHNNSLKIHECLQQERGHLKGKVFRLHEMHWVSLTPFYYTDDKHCWKVIDYERACYILELLADFPPNKIICIANDIL